MVKREETRELSIIREDLENSYVLVFSASTFLDSGFIPGI